MSALLILCFQADGSTVVHQIKDPATGEVKEANLEARTVVLPQSGYLIALHAKRDISPDEELLVD